MLPFYRGCLVRRKWRAVAASGLMLWWSVVADETR